MNKFIKTQFLAIAAVVTILGFSAFKMADQGTKKILAPVTIYFHGDPTNPSEVEDESNWSDTPNGQSCSGENLACSMAVDTDDLTSSGTLDPNKIQLGASQSPTGYTPEKTGGESPTEPEISNRN
ncbi:hypothetical protein FAZ19_11880 [Sphingobacterium alkalisoli]|uniref:Uncharacterized protein n=1 Tax=Sphingobacterium alkalisoli TaxID=1874115 RepID=A0A4U0H2F1_9SPHI|nr:hypothetical protein [Sphingobacterium alkalisoli]TJY65811.1 hypothetical protein FAZ19_11880 [Sphingobacterium alkalisoli]GGH18176.1 hypothetical protein GCM10011418_21640 [Sphingobacterium alkalisoli]